MSVNSFADETTCENTKHPLDELRYMDEKELNWNYCVAKKFGAAYLKFVQLGDYSRLDAVGVCTKVQKLTLKVLKKEYGAETPDCEALYPDFMGD